jgi:hypothetical protein
MMKSILFFFLKKVMILTVLVPRPLYLKRALMTPEQTYQHAMTSISRKIQDFCRVHLIMNLII